MTISKASESAAAEKLAELTSARGKPQKQKMPRRYGAVAKQDRRAERERAAEHRACKRFKMRSFLKH